MMSDDEAKKVGQLLDFWLVECIHSFCHGNMHQLKRSIKYVWTNWISMEKEWIESMELIVPAKSIKMQFCGTLEANALRWSIFHPLTFNLIGLFSNQHIFICKFITFFASNDLIELNVMMELTILSFIVCRHFSLKFDLWFNLSNFFALPDEMRK